LSSEASRELTAEAGGWQLEVSSVRDLQLKDGNQRGQEPLGTEAEDATLLKQLQDNVTENTALCVIVTCGV
jgi:hypothetical protein